MADIAIKLNTGDTIKVAPGTRIRELSARAAESAEIVAARLDGRPVDLETVFEKDAALEWIKLSEPAGLEIMRHSMSHVMAEAVRSLWPGVKVAIGPAIEDGFYYDFDLSTAFTPEDLPRIEARMAEIIAGNHPFVRQILPRAEAIANFRQEGEKYKVELLESLEGDEVSLYRQGDFLDLCRGPHVPATGMLKAFKLLSVAGAYWRGDERNAMLQRIYGTAFVTQEQLEAYLARLEEARRRDHRRLGRELDLFSLHEDVGPGLVIYHPKGALLRSILEDFEKREHLKRGYQMVIGPQILKLDLWKKSGHWDNYRENMYFTEIEEQGYGIKPMNCLAHMLIYKSRTRSFRDLPLRYFELGTVHRHEKSGVMHGLMRVRGFTQDDAHILCTPDQLPDEIQAIIDFVDYVMKIFKFPYEVEVSTRPEKFIGSEADWDRATTALKQALEKAGLPYDINEGDGAFYGPKIDFKLKDALDRKWQCATIQCDFTLPDRFDLEFIGSDGQPHRPVMLHRVIFGSLERFIGVLIEHFVGAFPLWLAPVQAIILTVTEKHNPYAEELKRKLWDAGVRVEADLRNEKLSFKIREAQVMKIPYMLVVGDKEIAEEGLSPRRRDGKNLQFMSIDNFLELFRKESEIGGG